MKKIATLLFLGFVLLAANAKTYHLSSGKWTDEKIWGGAYAGSVVKAADIVVITGQVTINTSITVEGILQVENGAAMVGNKDMVVAKNGKFINNGNTVVNRIYNEGIINNNLLLETMNDMDNKGIIANNNNIVAGNNLNNFGGNTEGKSGAYFVNNRISNSASARFGNDVKAYYGEYTETDFIPNASELNLNTIVKKGVVELNVTNPNKVDVAVFSIEKSYDGNNYTLVDMVTNNQQSAVAMSYIDTKNNSSFTYYRVKAIHSAGNETVLPVATVKGI